MKKIVNFSVTALLLLLVSSQLFIFCNRQEDAVLPGENSEAGQMVGDRSAPTGFSSFGLPFPEGTSFSIVGNTLWFDLPEPYYVLGIGKNGQFYRGEPGVTAGVTCTCNEGAGCDPIKSDNDYGCLMKSGCSKCTKSSATIVGTTQEMAQIIIVDPEAYLFVDDFSDLDGRNLLPHAFINSPQISSLLADLNALMPSSSPQGKKVVFINALGYILPIEVPADDDFDTTSLSFVGGAGTGSGVTCTCNIAGKSCPKDSKWGVVWCNSDNCTSCTMTGRVINQDGAERAFSEKDGRISLN